LFGKDRALVNGQATLREGRFQKLAIANPATAPYGAAAVEAMKALGVYDALTPKLVHGNNIAQTHQFVETGNAELGFVALSQIVRHAEGSRWLVPESLHAPIAQDAVLLKRGVDSEAARAFLALLKGPEGRVVVQKFGYGAGG
jgi:molybdate transport system substrate-binding protein